MAATTPPRLFLVDGYALIYRAFFAFADQQLVSSKGENTAIARGMLEFLRRLIERHHPQLDLESPLRRLGGGRGVAE